MTEQTVRTPDGKHMLNASLICFFAVDWTDDRKEMIDCEVRRRVSVLLSAADPEFNEDHVFVAPSLSFASLTPIQPPIMTSVSLNLRFSVVSSKDGEGKKTGLMMAFW